MLDVFLFQFATLNISF